MTAKYGRWLRVETIPSLSRKDVETHPSVINIDHVTKMRPWRLGDRNGTTFSFDDMSEVYTSEPFEEACLRLMVA